MMTLLVVEQYLDRRILMYYPVHRLILDQKALRAESLPMNHFDAWMSALYF